MSKKNLPARIDKQLPAQDRERKPILNNLLSPLRSSVEDMLENAVQKGENLDVNISSGKTSLDVAYEPKMEADGRRRLSIEYKG